MAPTTTGSLSAYGPARSTITGTPLSPEELHLTHQFWSACNYLALGMIYLQHNPLLKEPLQSSHIKNRLLGHWGSSPGLAFIYTHLNRAIRQFDQSMIFLAGPGHGAPGVLGPVYLEGTYSEVYPVKSEDEAGLHTFFKEFSFPGGIGSHCTPETPGSIHEGGELGYVLSHACGAAFDNPDLIVAAVVGDGESETGPLATSWHINKFLNPARDGAVLPILHLNGYKIDNPTLLARISHEEIENLFKGYGWTPFFVEGSDPETMHQAMAATVEHCVTQIRQIKASQSTESPADGGASFSLRGASAPPPPPFTRPRWPMIVLRTPKGWTAPATVHNHKLEGSWRAHQVPLPDVKKDENQLKTLEAWLRSFQPEVLFDPLGKIKPELKALTPKGVRRMGSNPITNGGILKKSLRLPDFRQYAANIERPGQIETSNTFPLGQMFRDIMTLNPHNFRVFGPDETSSNKLQALYETTKKLWLEEYFNEDSDGGNLARDGRVIEMLSEHTMEGMLEGYLLTGRHGFLSTYESFVHVIDSMFNQHAKWLSLCNHLSWRQDVASLNLLITSTVWRQDHNGFTHQDPGFLDVVVNKSAEVTRIYLPPDVNCLLATAAHCLQSQNYVNVIVCDKQLHLQYLSMDRAIEHTTKGIGIWDWASTDQGVEPDAVIATAGDIPTQEGLAASCLLREAFPDIKLRFVNVVDLFKLQPNTEHPHGLSDRDFDSLFTTSKPVIFNFHGYPWLIHRLAYRRHNHDNLHVRGYKEKGSINTPMELAINNEIDRFSIAIDVIDRTPRLATIGSHAKERFRNMKIEAKNYAYEHGIDQPEITGWKWPH